MTRRCPMDSQALEREAVEYAEYRRLKDKFEGWKTAKTAPSRAAMIDYLETAWRPKTDAAEVRA